MKALSGAPGSPEVRVLRSPLSGVEGVTRARTARAVATRGSSSFMRWFRFRKVRTGAMAGVGHVFYRRSVVALSAGPRYQFFL